MWGTIRRLGAVVSGVALVSGLVTGLATGAAAAPASAEPGRDALRQALAELAASGAAGVQVRLRDDLGRWTGAAGVRELGDDDPVSTRGRFRAGSITKTFVSTVLLQLVDEGELTLDDSVDRHLPEYGLDPRITVRMLLQHTSGLFNYTGEPNPDGTLDPGIPLQGQEFVDNRFHTYRPADLVEVALAKPARFEPGTGWSYSNTNYVLAGLLIERLTGTPYADQVRHRVIWPLGLRETILPGTWPHLPRPHAHGYYAYQHDGESRVVDMATVNVSWAFSAGEIVSTTRDLNRFYAALFGGRLLPAELLAEMRTTLPTGDGTGYGLGLESLDLGPECGGTYQGHTGGMPGYQSLLFHNADGSRRLAVSVTIGAVDLLGDPEALERLAVAFSKVISIAACGTAQPPAGATRLADTAEHVLRW